MRRERVRYISPEDYPEGHPGKKGPMLVQQFIDTGEFINYYRCLTLFGRPLYCMQASSPRQRIDLSVDDSALEAEPIAIQAVEGRTRKFIVKADVLDAALRVHNAIPEIALKGCDFVREAKTGKLYALEVNPGGNTWHFSSNHNARIRRQWGPEFVQQWYDQMDALGAAAHVLVERTMLEAE